ncbi:hypothetical protein [Clostridium sp. B9]|uniref:hypothetical protein n=1 Tax=Clostridium sp. B9 TaxID=3423224 RepID=UPI003D2ED10C
MKIKKIALTFSLATVLGVGIFGAVTAKASDEFQETTNNTQIESNSGYWCENNPNMNLSEEQQQLLDKGYNELTEDEKAFFDQYHGKSKRDLSEEDLNKYYEIHDKAFKYLGEETSEFCNERRAMRGNGCGNGQGMRRGNGQGRNSINK